VRYLPLLLANVLRKKTRLTLTVLSFAVAILLFGLLAAIRGAFAGGVDLAGVDRLLVIHKMSFIQPLPIRYWDTLTRNADVARVAHATWFGGVYQDERNFFAQFAIEHTAWRDVYPEFIVPDDQWRAFEEDRMGCIVGKATAEKYGFRLGDRVPLRGTIFEGAWEFNVRGIYSGRRPNDDTTQFWFRADYLREKAPAWYRDLVGWYVIRIKNPDDAPRVAREIDDAFTNSQWETKTQTEKSFAASFVKQMGNIELLLVSVGSVVFFTLLLITGNTMAIAVRERTSELAVLKALGFGDGFVLALVLAESLVVAVVGGGLGILSAKGTTVLLATALTGGMLPPLYLSLPAMIAGLGAAILVGLVSGLVPALSAMRLRVIEAIRRV
jgi:putative ABC transport system permease protein